MDGRYYKKWQIQTSSLCFYLWLKTHQSSLTAFGQMQQSGHANIPALEYGQWPLVILLILSFLILINHQSIGGHASIPSPPHCDKLIDLMPTDIFCRIINPPPCNALSSDRKSLLIKTKGGVVGGEVSQHGGEVDCLLGTLRLWGVDMVDVDMVDVDMVYYIVWIFDFRTIYLV